MLSGKHHTGEKQLTEIEMVYIRDGHELGKLGFTNLHEPFWLPNQFIL